MNNTEQIFEFFSTWTDTSSEHGIKCSCFVLSVSLARWLRNNVKDNTFPLAALDKASHWRGNLPSVVTVAVSPRLYRWML